MKHRRWLGIAAVALAGLFLAVTRVDVSGRWFGLFLLRGREARPLVLKDDLFLGDGSRLIAGVSFSRLRRLVVGEGAARSAAGRPHLELDWDEAQGSGLVRSHLEGGRELVTVFSRFTDDWGRNSRGLFVGGALPDVAEADDTRGVERRLNDSGMSVRDGGGWHHVWCNANEALLDEANGRMTTPGQWRYLGSRVLIRDAERVVLESSHEIPVTGGALRMDRFAYFRAGKPWVKLGVRILNAGEAPARFAWVYGDEPWVGDFGSAAGNVGWVKGMKVPIEADLDPASYRWAGIVDEKSDLANFVSWIGEALPDRVFFSNGPTTTIRGAPLSSNEVFVGLQWLGQRLAPGESRTYLLSLGLAEVPGPGAVPLLPEGAGPP